MRFSLRTLLPVLCLIATLTVPAEEVFRDREFAGGFNLSAPRTKDKPLELGVVLRASDAARNEWRLAQWGTQISLEGTQPKVLPDGTRILRNAGKTIKVFPGGLSGEGIILGVNGGTEFGGVPRKDGQFWPHLLIEQQFPRDFKVATAASLNFGLQFRVDGCKKAAEAPLDPALHSAQVTAYWTLQNQGSDSLDKGEMIWFGLPLFDARSDVPPGHQALDTAVENGKFIFTLEGSRFFQGPTGDGQWHKVACDLVPFMQEALAASQAKGFLTNTRFEDLYVTSFNLGWEVPGPYDCEITIKNLSLDRVEK